GNIENQPDLMAEFAKYKKDFSENSAFNKNFGTEAGTVMEGSRTFNLSQVLSAGNSASNDIQLDQHLLKVKDSRNINHELGLNYATDEYPSPGLVLRTVTNPNSGEPIFQVQSEGFAPRLRIEHDGAVKTYNPDIYVSIAADGSGGYKVWDESDFSANDLANFYEAFSWGDHAGKYAELTGDTFSGSVKITKEDALKLTHSEAELWFDTDTGIEGTKRITVNDGGGNFNFRANCYYNSGEKYLLAGDGAAHYRMNIEGQSNPYHEFRIARIGNAAEDTISWTSKFYIYSDSLSFQIDGNERFLVDSAGAVRATNFITTG
ncbi:hypothetical protein, partial [Xanthovirga aplysinae]|uniref:hypothetical protein n=1 Tax=Xanthovirga aplysinae TaxID=2529853 RepID=UPI001CA3C0C5